VAPSTATPDAAVAGSLAEVALFMVALATLRSTGVPDDGNCSVDRLAVFP
jgi:hypothetical protein